MGVDIFINQVFFLYPFRNIRMVYIYRFIDYDRIKNYSVIIYSLSDIVDFFLDPL